MIEHTPHFMIEHDRAHHYTPPPIYLPIWDGDCKSVRLEFREQMGMEMGGREGGRED